MSTRFAIAVAILLGITVAVPAATTITIVQRGLAFDRTSVSLNKGDQLSFANQDEVLHNVHIFGPGSDDSADLGLQKPGKSLTYRFDKAGSYSVRCNIHPSVKMAVTVK